MKGITAIILAGGKSSRMGEDKGLVLLDKTPMVKYVIDVVQLFVKKTILITNNKEYNIFGIPTYCDKIKNKGPLAGVYTGLYYSKTDINIVLSCDTPYINTALLTFLLNQHKTHEVTIPQQKNTVHPLIGIYSKRCLYQLKEMLDCNQLKMMKALKTLNLNVVDASEFDEKLFTNINTKSDIKS